MDILLIAAFVAYFVLVLGIGAYFYRRSAKMDEYFLAGRSLNPYVVAMSAQASDMSGWLLMGLPGSILAAGVGEIWIGIGLAIGTYFAWLVIAKRLRVYSEKANNSITLSEYISNRFGEQKGIIRLVCGIIILVFFTVYVASAFVAGGKVLGAIFPDFDYTILMIAGAVIVVIYTFLGGFKAVCWTDFFQGLLMLVAVVIVPLAVMGELGGAEAAWDAVESIAATTPDFNLDLISCGWIAIAGGLAWGLGYMGMPHILVRYMSIRDAKEIKISRRVATTWVVIALACACIIGLLGRAWVESNGMISEAGFDKEMIFIYLVNDLWAVAVPVLAGVLFAALMAAVMSTADSQLLVASSAVSNDIYKRFKGEDYPEEKLVWVSRIVVIVIAIIAAVIALDPTSSIMDLVSFAWAGFGASFGPVVLLSLFWKKVNGKGALAGLIVGFASVILWNVFLGYGSIISGHLIDTPVTGLYELLPAFIISAIAIIVVSLLTGGPSKEVEDTFDAFAAEIKETTAPKSRRYIFGIGLLAVVLFFGGILASGLGAEGWTFESTLDQLGLIGGTTSVLYFIGFFVAGFFVAVFSALASKNATSCLARTAGILATIAGICLMGVGFIDAGYADPHDILVKATGILGLISAVLLLADGVKQKHIFSAGAMFIVLLAMFAQVYGGIIPVSDNGAIIFALMTCVLIQAVRQLALPAVKE